MIIFFIRKKSVRSNFTIFTGAVHGAELIALLGDSLMLQVARRPMSQNEKEMSNVFRKYLTNFVKFGY